METLKRWWTYILAIGAVALAFIFLRKDNSPRLPDTVNIPKETLEELKENQTKIEDLQKQAQQQVKADAPTQSNGLDEALNNWKNV